MNSYDAFTVQLKECLAFLQSLDRAKTLSNRERIFHANFVEAFKLLVVIRHLMTPVADARLLTSEPVEALTRLLYERSLLVRRLEKFSGEEPFLRFLKTSDESMAEKWSGHARKHGNVTAKQLPNYGNMADDVDPSGESARIYRQLSHLAHPRSSIPYAVAEATQCKLRGATAHQYFEMRCDQLVPIVGLAMSQIHGVAKRELAGLVKGRT